MANELVVSFSAAYDDAESVAEEEIVAALAITMGLKKMLKQRQSFGFASEGAINLGNLTTLGFLFFKNLDPTNFVTVKVATSGAIFAKLFPGQFLWVPCGSGMTAPYAQADTAACDCLVMVFNR